MLSTTPPLCRCYVGKRRLEKAIEEYKTGGGKASFEIKWHPFFLDPSLPEEGVDKMTRCGSWHLPAQNSPCALLAIARRYKEKFGEERMAQMLPYMIEVGKKEGINFSVRVWRVCAHAR